MFIKKLFITIGVFLIFSVVFYLTLFFGNKILIEKDFYFMTNGIGAFMGAFFAFLFFILGKLFTEIYLRNKKHRNGLVKTEYMLNDYLSMNNDNIFLINGFMEAIFINEKNICIDHFTNLEINKDLLLDIYNIDLINDLHTLNINIYKANESLKTAWLWNNKINESFLDKKMSEESYSINLRRILKQFQVLKKFLKALEERILIIQSKTRVLLREQESAIDWFIKITSHKEHYANNFDKKYQEELKKIKIELEQNMEISKKEIDNMLQS